MIITKKQFEEEIAKAKAEEAKKLEARLAKFNEQRLRDESLSDMNRRMDHAFEDINRRLTELEKRSNVNPDIPVCRSPY